MSKIGPVSRRAVVKSSVFGLLAASLPCIASSETKETLFHRYPSIDDAVAMEVVGASHFDLGKVKKLVTARPELARATWDWGFGDWETAVGAASHVGRRDIADFLIANGARPDIFTFAMLGAFDAVKSIVESKAGVQRIAGPHGISLLQHARAGLRMEETLSEKQKGNCKGLISYLVSLGDADSQDEYLEMEASTKDKYLGEYKFGNGAEDGFNVSLNMRKLLSISRMGKFGGGGTLFQVGENRFICNGTKTAEITFLMKNESVASLTIHEPGLTLTAMRT